MRERRAGLEEQRAAFEVRIAAAQGQEGREGSEGDDDPLREWVRCVDFVLGCVCVCLMCVDGSVDLMIRRADPPPPIDGVDGRSPTRLSHPDPHSTRLQSIHRYINWLQEAYPSDSAEATLLLERCARRFQDEGRYKQDPRYLKVCSCMYILLYMCGFCVVGLMLYGHSFIHSLIHTSFSHKTMTHSLTQSYTPTPLGMNLTGVDLLRGPPGAAGGHLQG